jgi:hypothetical protein
MSPSSVNLNDRRATWEKSGWTGYDAASKPYDAAQVRKERELYTTSR